jgi:hypothetical protein
MKSTLLLCILGIILTAAKPLSEIELVKKRVLSERVEILIPKGFEVMTEQQMDFAYAKAQSRPSVIFTNNNLISLAFNYSDNDADQDMVDVYSASFGKTYHKQYEMGHEVYTLVFFTDVEGKLMICTFNCADRQKPEWEPIAKQIMLSLKAKG